MYSLCLSGWRRRQWWSYGKKQHVEKQITSGRERESIKCWRREKGQNDKTQNAHKTFCQYIHQEENYLEKKTGNSD